MVIPYDWIEDVTRVAVEPSDGRIPEKTVVDFAAEPPMKLRVPKLNGGADFPFLVEGVLLGPITSNDGDQQE